MSFPDISLLVPLSQALDVTVMELLQGRKFEAERKDDLRLDLSEVEQLVKRAVMFSGETNEEKKLRRKKNGPIFAKLLAVSVAEVIVCAVLLFYILANERNPLYINCITCFGTLEILGIAFGVHIWLFMKDRLPSYYDENRISEYADGMFRMSMPGLYFNNKNWKPITVVLKKWNAAVLVGVPLWCIFMLLFIKEWSVALTFSLVVLVIYFVRAVCSGVCGWDKKGCLIYQAPRCIIIIESESDVKSDLPSVIALRNSNALVGGCYFFLL